MKNRNQNELEKDPNKAIVLGLEKKLEKTKDPAREGTLDELKLLLSTLKIETCASFLHRYHKLNPAILIGTGKLEEIKSALEKHGAGTLVVDHALTPLQVRNLEKATGCVVLDRALVIINIFSSHARTKEAKLQVEIARLEYLLPRLTGAWTHFQRQKGGGALSRGMGETQIEVDRRRARERISHLKKSLKALKTSRGVQRKKRDTTLKVALVGYTNSGKTSIMSSLSKLKTAGKDELFATLDSKTRVLDPSTHPRILISDTVGFIRNLPHDLIESFKSTLEEVKYADLLLHVVDLSHRDYMRQLETTEKVLEEIGASEIPTLLVFNKIDQIEDELLPKIIRKKFPMSALVSSFSKDKMLELRDKILEHFKHDFPCERLFVPKDHDKTMGYIHSNCLITDSDYSRVDGVELEIKASRHVLQRLEKFFLIKKENNYDSYS